MTVICNENKSAMWISGSESYLNKPHVVCNGNHTGMHALCSREVCGRQTEIHSAINIIRSYNSLTPLDHVSESLKTTVCNL